MQACLIANWNSKFFSQVSAFEIPQQNKDFKPEAVQKVKTKQTETKWALTSQAEMCSKFKVLLGIVWSYFSSLHFRAEIARVTGIKALPVQFQEWFLLNFT